MFELEFSSFQFHQRIVRIKKVSVFDQYIEEEYKGRRVHLRILEEELL